MFLLCFRALSTQQGGYVRRYKTLLLLLLCVYAEEGFYLGVTSVRLVHSSYPGMCILER